MQQLNAIAKDIQGIESEKVTMGDRLSVIELKLESRATIQTNISAYQNKIAELGTKVRTITKKTRCLEKSKQKV